MRPVVCHWAAWECCHVEDHILLPLVHTFWWNWWVGTENAIRSGIWVCRNAIGGGGVILYFELPVHALLMDVQHSSVAILPSDEEVDGVLQDQYLVR